MKIERNQDRPKQTKEEVDSAFSLSLLVSSPILGKTEDRTKERERERDRVEG